MPQRSLTFVHENLLQMIRQDFSSSSSASASANGRAQNGNGNGLVKRKGSSGMEYVWQVRHAGLLGMKYEVAVRNDMIDGGDRLDVLRAVVDAAVLGYVHLR